jgi:hypothetical protein
MQDSAIEIDCAVAEKRATQAGRKSVAAADEANKESAVNAKKIHADWQEQANEIWKQHASKSKVDVSNLIARNVGGNPNTIRRAIKKLS